MFCYVAEGFLSDAVKIGGHLEWDRLRNVFFENVVIILLSLSELFHEGSKSNPQPQIFQHRWVKPMRHSANFGGECFQIGT